MRIKTTDLWSQDCGFNSRSSCYQAVTTWTGDCLQSGKPSRYITNTNVNSAFHPPEYVNRVPACMAGVETGVFTCVRWQVTLCDPIWQVRLRSSKMDELYRLTITISRSSSSSSCCCCSCCCCCWPVRMFRGMRCQRSQYPELCSTETDNQSIDTSINTLLKNLPPCHWVVQRHV